MKREIKRGLGCILIGLSLSACTEPEVLNNVSFEDYNINACVSSYVNAPSGLYHREELIIEDLDKDGNPDVISGFDTKYVTSKYSDKYPLHKVMNSEIRGAAKKVLEADKNLSYLIFRDK